MKTWAWLAVEVRASANSRRFAAAMVVSSASTMRSSYAHGVAWEWVGPVSTGAVGIAGIFGTYWGTSRQTDTALKVATTQLSADLDAKDRERTQRRIETAYTELARWLSLYGAWAIDTMPMMTSAAHDSHPTPPGAGGNTEVHGAEALRVYWSPAVDALMKPWVKARQQLYGVSMEAKSYAEGAARGTASGELYRQAEEYRQALFSAEDKIITQIRFELRGDETSPAAG